MATGDDLRIVSLLPSLTDIVAELGLAERVVGVTHECDNGLVLKRAGKGPVVVTESYIDPKAEQKEINDAVIESLAQNHSLYALKEDSLRPLAPTHVLTQSLCDVCAVAFEQVKSKCSRLLADKPYKLLSVEPSTLQDVRVSLVQGLGPHGPQVLLLLLLRAARGLRESELEETPVPGRLALRHVR